MRASLVFAALLCFTTWMGIAHATHAVLVNCVCVRWSTTQPPLNRIVNYTVQSEGTCPIAAIRFHTKHGKTICSHPSSDWAVKAKAKVDEENRKKASPEPGQTEVGSTSTVTPAEPTTSTKAPQKITEAKVDEENGKKASQEPGQTEEGSTSTVTPAEPNTSTKAPQKVDEENGKKASQEPGQTEVGSTSTVTPAEPTTSTKAPQKITKAKVDEENGKKALQEPGQTEEGSTSSVTPAELTKSKKARQKGGRKGRRLLGRFSRKWRKRQLRRRG